MVFNHMVKFRADLDHVFAALAHPARRLILERLGQGEATVAQLAQPLQISLPAVTKHLNVLERAHPDRAWPVGSVASLSFATGASAGGRGMGEEQRRSGKPDLTA